LSEASGVRTNSGVLEPSQMDDVLIHNFLNLHQLQHETVYEELFPY